MLPICVGCIYSCYFTYGYLQEDLIAIAKVDAVLPLLCQYSIGLFCSSVISLVMDWYNNTNTPILNSDLLTLGGINTCTMFSSNYALAFIDYPTQALVKSSKILPVMAFGVFRKTYDYSLYKYICAFFITVGLIVFNLAKLGSKVNDMSFNYFGIFLLFLSLFFDGLLATQTDKVKKKKKAGGPFQMMINNNIVGITLCFIPILYEYYHSNVWVFDQVTAENTKEILLIGICGALGQIVTYLTIKRFDCFILSVVNTSRKFFSILFSILWFGHHITFLHKIGIAIVCGSIAIDVIFSEMERREKQKQKSA